MGGEILMLMRTFQENMSLVTSVFSKPRDCSCNQSSVFLLFLSVGNRCKFTSDYSLLLATFQLNVQIMHYILLWKNMFWSHAACPYDCTKIDPMRTLFLWPS